MLSQTAYGLFGLLDPSTCTDEDVVAAYVNNTNLCAFGENPSQMKEMKKALDAIALDRKSRLLYFVTNIICDEDPASTSNRWSVADTRLRATSSPDTVGTPDKTNLGQGKEVAEGSSSSGTHILTPQSSNDAPSGDQDHSLSIEDNGDAGSGEPSDWEYNSDAYSSEADTTSNISDSDHSEFTLENKGYIWHSIKNTWYCQECDTAVVDGSCPNGHVEEKCIVCNRELEGGVCPTCDLHAMDKLANKAGEEPDQIAYDYDENVWRCVTCQWEIEATSEQGGHCFCTDDQGERHYHDLSECPDYEPGEEFDSEVDSEDSEPDSEDEWFIDDPKDDTVDNIESVDPSQPSDPTQTMLESHTPPLLPAMRSDVKDPVLTASPCS